MTIPAALLEPEPANEWEKQPKFEGPLTAAIFDFVLDNPGSVPDAARKVPATAFQDFAQAYVWAYYLECWEKLGEPPTRMMCRQHVAQRTKLEEDPNDEIMNIFDRPNTNPKEVMLAGGMLKRFIRQKLVDYIYSDHMLDMRVNNLDAALLEHKRVLIEVDELDKNFSDEFTWADLIEEFPNREPPIIDGLVREGQTANLVSSSKQGKSWMVYGLALSVLTGRKWLGTFPTSQGKVLLIDNELSGPELAHRTRKVAEAMGIKVEDYAKEFVIKTLKHRPQSLQELVGFFGKIKPHEYKLIIMDAMYKFLDEKADENSNSDIGRFYGLLTSYAEATKAAIVLVHHSTKGSQSEKKVTDVGSGAGAQSRAPDCHLVFREHEVEGAMVLDAVVRSFPPIKPKVIRFEWPIWVPDECLDPKQLATTANRQQQSRDEAGKNQILQLLKESGGMTRSLIRKETGMGDQRVIRLINLLVTSGEIESRKVEMNGNSTEEYVVR